jgi:hypothetical protein
MRDSLDYFVKAPKAELGMWCAYFEAFEGMLSLRTPAPPKDQWGIIHMMVSPDYRKEFERCLRSSGLRNT